MKDEKTQTPSLDEMKSIQHKAVSLAERVLTQVVARFSSELGFAIKPGAVTEESMEATEIILIAVPEGMGFNVVKCCVAAMLTRATRECFTAEEKVSSDVVMLHTGLHSYLLRLVNAQDDLSQLKRIGSQQD